MSSMDWLEFAFPDSTNPAYRIQAGPLGWEHLANRVGRNQPWLPRVEPSRV